MNKKGCDAKEEGRGGAQMPQQGGGRRRGVAGEAREAASQDQGVVPRMKQNL